MPKEPETPTAAEFAALTVRVYALECALGLAVGAEPLPAPEPAEVAAEPSPVHVLSAPPAVPEGEAEGERFAPLPAPWEMAPPPGTHAPVAEMGWEARLGTHWFSRIGVLALMLAAAWLLEWGSDNGWIGPAERVWLGLAVGIGCVAWGERFWRKGAPVSAYSLFGLGNGVWYLSLWAAFALYHLVSSVAVFVPMAAITAWNGYRSYANDAPVFAAYALLLGYSIPVLLASHQSHQLQLAVFC